MSVTVLDNPLINDRATKIRMKETPSSDFYNLVLDIGALMTYEISKEFEEKLIDIETPVCKAQRKVIASKIIIVPILRAGLGLAEGIRRMIPNASVGFLGMYRDEVTKQPVEYYAKLPDLKDAIVILADPMLATGGSAALGVEMLKKRGAQKIIFAGLVGAQAGIDKLQKEHPDVNIYLAQLDDGMNENCYIVPGLGDCGDRLYGTD